MSLKSLCIIPLIVLSGCAGKNTILKTAHGLEQSYTGSPCVDGVITNVRESGCELASVYTVPMTRTIKIECVERSLENPWTTYSFYMIPHGDMYVTDNMFLMCTDPMFKVAFTEPLITRSEQNEQEE